MFDSAAQTLAWAPSSGEGAKTKLEKVTDLSQPIAVRIVLHGTVADVLVNNHRTLIHRLATPAQHLAFTALQGETTVSDIAVSTLP